MHAGSRYGAYWGIDYSGAARPGDRLPGIALWEALPGREPRRVPPPGVGPSGRGQWSREVLARAVLERVLRNGPTIIGIDHAFGFPDSYLGSHGLETWDDFLDDFVRHWPTHEPERSVESLRAGNARTGQPHELRLTERWTSSARSVFRFDVQGSVAKSSHAGIPWLRWLQRNAGDRVHFWPFDGWEPPAGRTVVAEVYPALFHRRYFGDAAIAGLDAHHRDAYAIARWLNEMDATDRLGYYFNPPLTAAERAQARREGWILGVC